MVVTYGKQDFIVDFDTGFIQKHSCFLDGKQCMNCNLCTDCTEELDFVFKELECIKEKI